MTDSKRKSIEQVIFEAYRNGGELVLSEGQVDDLVENFEALREEITEQAWFEANGCDPRSAKLEVDLMGSFAEANTWPEFVRGVKEWHGDFEKKRWAAKDE